MRGTIFSCNEVNRSEANRMAKKRKPNPKMQEWIDARKRHHLSHAQVQMARELGMNPIKLGKLDNHKQESWKMPLREYIEHLYLKRFGKSSPDNITSVEERLRLAQQKKETCGVHPATARTPISHAKLSPTHNSRISGGRAGGVRRSNHDRGSGPLSRW